MAVLFATERLTVRTWQPERDAEQAFAIYGDREVMRFVGKGQWDRTVGETRDRLQQRVDLYRRRNNGTGLWAVVETETTAIIGTILLVQLPDARGTPTSEYEIGWHFRRASWGRGYATEAARGIVDYGFETLHLSVLFAVVKAENERSRRVTQRLGMTPKGLTDRYYGVELLLFELRETMWRERSQISG